MLFTPSEVAAHLARNAEAVCRCYLSNGRRRGRYWIVGNVCNFPGRSMFVRLAGPAHGRGAAGKWTDAATGEHGDLLDIIRGSLGLVEFKDVMDEARRFLLLPHEERHSQPTRRPDLAPTGSPEAARRLLAISKSIVGTIAEKYLHSRGIVDLQDTPALRFHPRCYYVPDDHHAIETWPAMIATVTDLVGNITGAHRTWLAPDGHGKAPVDTPRRAMGELLGHAVRFGTAHDAMAAGEGIETMLSLRQALPNMPMAAALSANHLAAMHLPSSLRRLYIARDDDAAGDAARDTLVERARAAGIEPIALSPKLDDFNDDLVLLGIEALTASIRVQLAPEDVARFLTST
ncbi:MAG: toprim domain-containing protein [Devosia sp.]|nr:toprim domain-containing protein [Devosia sp.]